MTLPSLLLIPVLFLFLYCKLFSLLFFAPILLVGYSWMIVWISRIVWLNYDSCFFSEIFFLGPVGDEVGDDFGFVSVLLWVVIDVLNFFSRWKSLLCLLRFRFLTTQANFRYCSYVQGIAFSSSVSRELAKLRWFVTAHIYWDATFYSFRNMKLGSNYFHFT